MKPVDFAKFVIEESKNLRTIAGRLGTAAK